MSDQAISPGAIVNGQDNTETFSPDQDISRLQRETHKIKVMPYSFILHLVLATQLYAEGMLSP